VRWRPSVRHGPAGARYQSSCCRVERKATSVSDSEGCLHTPTRSVLRFPFVHHETGPVFPGSTARHNLPQRSWPAGACCHSDNGNFAMISLVVPTYKEKKNIENLVARGGAALAATGEPYELIVVDDNSPDGTADEVRRFQPSRSWLKLVVREN